MISIDCISILGTKLVSPMKETVDYTILPPPVNNISLLRIHNKILLSPHTDRNEHMLSCVEIFPHKTTFFKKILYNTL